MHVVERLGEGLAARLGQGRALVVALGGPWLLIGAAAAVAATTGSTRTAGWAALGAALVVVAAGLLYSLRLVSAEPRGTTE